MAFDINPFPDKDQESKTWLSEDAGPITSLNMLMERANYFGLQPARALKVLAEVHAAVRAWRAVALTPAVGLLANELEDFAPAFEHAEMNAVQGLLGS